LAAFEAGDLDAVVFDAPILAYYANSETSRPAQAAPRWQLYKAAA